MRRNIIILLALCFGTVFYAQNKEWGSRFEFDAKTEQNPRFVLADNYNHYLLSVVNTVGMLSKSQVILRKFDQKNQLVDTYTQDFPKFDIATLHNYLGFVEAGNKVIVFTQSYSGRAKKSDIYKHEFDKATSKFTSTLIVSYPIESAMKSGNVVLKKSENNHFIGINYTKHATKKDPEQNFITVLDEATLNVAWQKEAVFPADNFYTQYFTITNSGKAVLLRSSRGSKAESRLTVVSADGQEDKSFGEEIRTQEPRAVSIGTQDYLMAFNSPLKGVRSGDYDSFLLYDLQAGKIIGNTKVSGFDVIKDLSEIEIKSIFIQNNEFHIFTEAKVKIVSTKPTVGGFSASSSFDDPEFKYGASHLIVMSFEGAVTLVKNLDSDPVSNSTLYHSYGLLNIKGNYCINGGYHAGVYFLSASNKYEKAASIYLSLVSGEDSSTLYSSKVVDQLMYYFNDSNKLLLARIFNEKEMSILTVSDFVK